MRPPVIGLIGGIGAGKSSVAQILRELGCVVSDSDRLARKAFEDDEIIRRLVLRWGERIMTSTTAAPTIDRRAVAEVVFHDPEERRWLESIVHPWIEARRAAEFAAAPDGTAALVIDAPLLLEAGLEKSCDAVFFVDTPRAVRLERLAATRGWDDAELARRESAQWSLDEKRLRATHVIANDGDPAMLRGAVEAALDDVRRGTP